MNGEPNLVKDLDVSNNQIIVVKVHGVKLQSVEGDVAIPVVYGFGEASLAVFQFDVLSTMAAEEDSVAPNSGPFSEFRNAPGNANIFIF